MAELEKNIKIIIADDIPEFIEGLKVLLTMSEKYQIIDILNDGEALVNSSVLHKANLILTDIEMPIMNGFEAAKRINYNYPDIPIIALTMYFDKIYLEDIIKAGFRAFIHKPNIADELFDVIDKVLNNKFIFPHNLRLKNC